MTRPGTTTAVVRSSFKVHDLAPIGISHAVNDAELSTAGDWILTVINDSLAQIKFSTSVTYPTKVAAPTVLPDLKSILITFNTNGDSKDDRDPDTVLHVFIKNRSSDTSFVSDASDFISNHLAYLDYASKDPYEVNPYLASAEALSLGNGFGSGSSHQFEIALRKKPIPCREIVLPVIDIHILANGNDSWVFNYTVEFLFADPAIKDDPNHKYDFSFTSTADGVPWIALDNNYRNYSGIGTENPQAQVSAPMEWPKSDSVLTRVTLDFLTRGDNKDPNTQFDVHIVNRVNATVEHDIAIAKNLLPGIQFQDDTNHIIIFGQDSNQLAANNIRLQDIVLPIVKIIIRTSGDDTWIFDVRVTYYFSYASHHVALQYASTTSGIILSGTVPKFAAVYSGGSFPQLPPVAPQFKQIPPIDHKSRPKQIPFSFLNRKLEEFINNRQSHDPAAQDAALFNIRLHNSGFFGSTPPSNYYDVAFIDANPPAPGTVRPPGYLEPVKWDSSPSDLGPNGHFGKTFVAFNDINCTLLKLQLTPTGPTPLMLSVGFETEGPPEIIVYQVEAGPRRQNPRHPAQPHPQPHTQLRSHQEAD